MSTHAIRKSTKLIIEIVAGFMALCALAVIMLIARLLAGPMTLTSLTSPIEYLLSQPQYGIEAKISQSLLDWDNDKHRFVLDLSNVEFTDSLKQRVANVPQILLVLHPLGYFDESHSPWVVSIKHPHMHMRIDKEGMLRLGALGGSGDKALNADAQAQTTESNEQKLDMESAKSALQDIIHTPHLRASGLGLFANLNVEDAGLTIIDEPKETTWNIEVPSLLFKRTGNDYHGKAEMLVKKAESAAKLDFVLDYLARDDRFHASWSFDHVNPSLFTSYVAQLKILDVLSSPLTGTISIDFDDSFTIYQGALNLNLDKGALTLKSIYPGPLAFSGGQIAARYLASEKKVMIEPLQLDLEHMTVKAKAEVDVREETRKVDAHLAVEKLKVEKLPLYWPETAAPNPRAWITENIKGGMIDKADVDLSLAFKGADIENAEVGGVKGHVDVSGSELTYWEPLPHLKDVSAEASFTDEMFDIDVTRGVMGDVKLKPSHLTITGLNADNQIMDLTANIEGPAADILSTLDRPPLGYAKKINIRPQAVSGNAAGTLKMKFPLLKALTFDEIELNANTKISNGKIDNLAGLMNVDKADADLTVDKNKLGIEGTGELNGIPSKLKWDETFAPASGAPYSKAHIEANTQAQSIRYFGVDIDVRTEKPIPFVVDYVRYAALSKLSVEANAGASRLELPDLSFVKEEGKKALINTTLEWGDGKPMRLSELKVEGEGLNVKGSGQFDVSGKKLVSLSLNPFNVGITHARLDLTYAGDMPRYSISGDVIDIHKWLQSSPDENGKAKDKAEAKKLGPLAIDLNMGRMITGEKAALTNVKLKAERNSAGWNAFNLSCNAAAGTPFTFVLANAGGGRTLNASTPDFGHVLQGFDVTDTLSGGKLTIEGKSEASDREAVFGHIKLEKFHVKNMPFLAQLISAISPDGLAALLTGSGLGFSELNGEYLWKGDVIDIQKAHTSTGSLGLTTAGKLDLGAGSMNLQGQVIPVVFISKILSNIPIVGDILTGGDNGGLFSATYTIKGPIAHPSTSINPVSVLAPGILRNILFMDKGSAAPAAPEKKR